MAEQEDSFLDEHPSLKDRRVRYELYGLLAPNVSKEAALNLADEWVRLVKKISVQGSVEDIAKRLAGEIRDNLASMERVKKEHRIASEPRRGLLLEMSRLHKERKERKEAAGGIDLALERELEHLDFRASQFKKEAERGEHETRRLARVLIKLRSQDNLLIHFVQKLQRGEDLVLPEILKKLMQAREAQREGEVEAIIEAIRAEWKDFRESHSGQMQTLEQRLEQRQRKAMRETADELKEAFTASIQENTAELLDAITEARHGDALPLIPFSVIGQEGFRLLVLAYVFNAAPWNSVDDACTAAADLIYFINDEEHVQPDTLRRKDLEKIRQAHRGDYRLRFTINRYKTLLLEKIEGKLDRYTPIVEEQWMAWKKAGRPPACFDKPDEPDEPDD